MSISHMPLNILYQDDFLVIIHKPAGYLVHPAEKPQADDLVAMKILRDQISKHVYSIHRIDRPTAGVLLFGIDREISKMLHQDLAEQKMQKVYWAVVEGKPNRSQWSCSESIKKHEDAPSRSARTDFDVIKTLTHPSGKVISLIQAVPHTGRFHQIRKHLLAAGYPIIGDYRYAGVQQCEANAELLNTGTRMLLLARSLTLQHPKTNTPIYAEAQEPLIDKLFDL